MSAATKPTTIDLQRARSQRNDVAASTMQAIFETQLALRRCRAFEELAGLDPLTQLGNRRYLYERLPAMIERGLHDGTPLTVAMVDLDHFKQVNDNHSHDVGDAVLQAVARLMRQLFADDGFAVQLGGEEFLVVVSAVRSTACVKLLEQLRRVIETHPWSSISPGLVVTASVGVATSMPGETQTTLLRRADEHLYEAKRAGRNCIRVDAGCRRRGGVAHTLKPAPPRVSN